MQLIDRFFLSEGPVEISYPSVMAPHDIEEFEQRIEIMLRRFKRNAGERSPEQGPAPGLTKQQGPVPI
jgi:hypothetical protein